MNAPLRLERPQLLTDMAMARIRTAIFEGQIELGQQVSEAQLALQLGVSKTPVREALVRLAHDGLVEVHPQRGSFVFKLDADQVEQLCRYRAMVETAALREAMAAARPQLAAALAERVAAMREAEAARDLRALARIDMDFHWQFFAHCPNGYLSAGYEVIRGQLTALRHRSPIENAVGSHQILVDAVAGDDVESAAALLAEHVFENEPRYRAACDPA
ncbi:MAG: GntR family transcriptional regulator [Caldimonas sp.]